MVEDRAAEAVGLRVQGVGLGVRSLGLIFEDEGAHGVEFRFQGGAEDSVFRGH